jgi:hypothetical protein
MLNTRSGAAMAMHSLALGKAARGALPDCNTAPLSSHSAQGQGEVLSRQLLEK